MLTQDRVPHHTPSDYPNPEEYRKKNCDFLLRSMGIAHAEGTKVGNEYVRGVSGGERKRVSIIEVLATRASVFCWDNSTRGLGKRLLPSSVQSYIWHLSKALPGSDGKGLTKNRLRWKYPA